MKQAHANIDEAPATLRDMARPGSEVLEHERQAIKMVLAEVAELRKDRERLDVELAKQRQGLVNIRDFRKIAGSDRYGNLTREEIDEQIARIDAAREGR